MIEYSMMMNSTKTPNYEVTMGFVIPESSIENIHFSEVTGNIKSFDFNHKLVDEPDTNGFLTLKHDQQQTGIIRIFYGAPFTILRGNLKRIEKIHHDINLK